MRPAPNAGLTTVLDRSGPGRTPCIPMGAAPTLPLKRKGTAT
jgi:hypothetical protein